MLGRLAARNRACQQDAVREGVVPVLVEMMMDGEQQTLSDGLRLWCLFWAVGFEARAHFWVEGVCLPVLWVVCGWGASG